MLRRSWSPFALCLLPALLAAGGCSDDPQNLLDGGTNGAVTPTTVAVTGDGGTTTGGATATTSATTTGGSSSDTTTTGPGASPIAPTETEYIADQTAMSGLPQETIDQLKQGSDQCLAEMIYPYAGTVFPGGLLSPPMMWHGGSDAAYIKLDYQQLNTLSYEFAVGASNPGEMRIPQADWDQIVARTQNTPLNVTFTVLAGGKLSTCKTQWKVARGNMVGSIYYNTYNHPDTGGQGAIMRMRLGQAQSDVYLSYQGGPTVPLLGPCKSCHSVSANGSTLVSSEHDYLSKTWKTEKFQVTDGTQPAPERSLENATFGALTPDGSHMLAMGNPQCTAGADSFPRASNNFPLVEGPEVAHLLDTQTGERLDAAGLKPEWYMWMPQFSPNGNAVAFNHAKPAGDITDRRELAVASYDPVSHAFGEPRVLVSGLGATPTLPYMPNSAAGGPIAQGLGGCTDGAGDNILGGIPIPGIPGNTAPLPAGTCDGPCYPAWPFFTPDGKGIVFALTSEPDFAYAIPGRDAPAKSELWYVEVETGMAVRLDKANAGLAPGDSLANYYPTVLPVQVGGYFWVFWTSSRAWGHRDLGAEPGSIPLGTSEAAFNAVKKRIWVTALEPRLEISEFGVVPLADMSAPAFYLEGQSGTGNVRAFAALNPCVDDGTECTSGLDCCSGYCIKEDGETVGTCQAEPPMCAELNDKCETSEDCCPPDDPADPPALCLGGYCGFVVIQ